MGFGLALAVPYILSQSAVPLVVTSPTVQVLIERRIYPFLLLASLTIAAGVFQVRLYHPLFLSLSSCKFFNFHLIIIKSLWSE
jgi:hypothetical protein